MAELGPTPLAEDRSEITTLHKVGSDCTAIQQQIRAFESELCTYTGDDPLDVWDRYINWAVQTYPLTGLEKDLTGLLERAVHLYAHEQNYYDDARYLNLWIKLAQRSNGPSDIYKYMQAQGIGITKAAFYIAWSDEFEKHGDFRKADAILQEGIKCGAQPYDILHHNQTALQSRAPFKALIGEAPGAQDDEENGPRPRPCLVDLRPRGKRKSPKNSEKVSLPGHTQGLSRMIQSSQDDAHVLGLDKSQWRTTTANEHKLEPLLASISGRAMKNEYLQTKQGKLKSFSDSSVRPSKSNLNPFNDESGQASNNILLLGQPPKESSLENLQVQQSLSEEYVEANEQRMYCKELVGTAVNEFSFEELRAERYFKSKHQDILEKNTYLSNLREELSCQIKEKQKLLQIRKSQLLEPQDLATEDEDFHLLTKLSSSQQPAAPFKIQDDMQSSFDLASGSTQESSVDVSCPTMSGLCPSSTLDAQLNAVRHLEKLPTEPEMMDHNTLSRDSDLNNKFVSAEDACSVDMRRKLLKDMDWTAYPNVNVVAAPLPLVEEDMLSIGNEIFSLFKVLDCEEYSIYQSFSSEEVFIKVDHCLVLWDLYNSLQFAERQCNLVQDLKPLTNTPTHWYLFLDGCITVYKVPIQDTVQRRIELYPLQMAKGLVELLRRLHSCCLILGVVNPETLFYSQSVFEVGNQVEAVVPVDFSSCMDLELQPEVTTAYQLSTAQTFVNQGLLEPTANPFQVDLMHFAETVHVLLTRKSMHLVKVDFEWVPEEYSKADTSVWMEAFWNKFFRILLNPGVKTSLCVLNQLLQEIDCI